MRKELQRKSAVALGISVISLLFLLETSFAHRVTPSPASPVVWGVLGAVSAIALGLSVFYRWKARSATD